MSYKVLIYQHDNLGDIIQTLAISRWLPPTNGIMRDKVSELPGLSIINGFIARPTPSGDCLFAGVHIATGYRRLRRWLLQSRFPVGTRDPFSDKLAQEWGAKTEMIGCATMTLPRYEGPREGIYSVDFDGPGTKLTHRIKRRRSLDRQWRWALRHLDVYRKAEAVYTSRLHVAIPCLAFGTPVYIDDTNNWRQVRFSILEKLGVPMRTLTTVDLTPHRDRYVRFLVENGVEVTPEHDPIKPKI